MTLTFFRNISLQTVVVSITHEVNGQNVETVFNITAGTLIKSDNTTLTKAGNATNAATPNAAPNPGTPSPNADTPTPAPNAETPAPADADTPTPNAGTPTPANETPTPNADIPTPPNANTPVQPNEDTPAPPVDAAAATPATPVVGEERTPIGEGDAATPVETPQGNEATPVFGEGATPVEPAPNPGKEPSIPVAGDGQVPAVGNEKDVPAKDPSKPPDTGAGVVPEGAPVAQTPVAVENLEPVDEKLPNQDGAGLLNDVAAQVHVLSSDREHY